MTINQNHDKPFDIVISGKQGRDHYWVTGMTDAGKKFILEYHGETFGGYFSVRGSFVDQIPLACDKFGVTCKWQEK